MAFLTGNAHFDQSVRQDLNRLKHFAEHTNAAVILIRHLNKSGGRHSLYRGSGSIGIIAATRSALLAANDFDQELPDSGYDGWRLVSFSKKHCNHEDPDKYVRSFDLRTREVTPANIGLARKLRVNLAFFLSYYEHGLGAWSLIGEGTQCPWDTAYLAGLLVWTGKPGDIGAKTLEDRAEDARGFLESFNDWANGNCYWFRLSDEKGEEIESFGGLVGDEALSEVVGKSLQSGDNVLVTADAAWLKDRLELPDGVNLVDEFSEPVEAVEPDHVI